MGEMLGNMCLANRLSITELMCNMHVDYQGHLNIGSFLCYKKVCRYICERVLDTGG